MRKQREAEVWVAHVLSADSELPPTARLVAVVMARFMNWDTLEGAYPGPGRVAHMTGLHISTVKKQLALLCQRGWLRQQSKGGAPRSGARIASVYQGTYPSHDATGSSDDPSPSAQGPVAENAPTRSDKRADPSRKATPSLQDPVSNRGHEVSTRPRAGTRSGSPRTRRARDNVGKFSDQSAGVFDAIDGELVRRSEL